MITHLKSSNSQLGEITRQMKQHFSGMLQNLGSAERRKFHLDRISELLESLALATDEYDLANRRIKNTQRYFQSNEIGAAKYEIRLLTGVLRSHLGTNV